MTAPALKCFVCMPFDAGFNDVFDAIHTTVEKEHDSCIRVDKLPFVGNIVSKIHEQLDQADYLVMDLTGTHTKTGLTEAETNPNVAYELGYALAHNKIVIPIMDGSRAPFNFSQLARIPYDRKQLGQLKGPLGERIREVTAPLRLAVPGYSQDKIDQITGPALVVCLGIAKPVKWDVHVRPFLKTQGLDHLPYLELTCDESVKNYSHDELCTVTEKYAAALKRLGTLNRVRTIHVFYGGPTAAALRLGQELRPLYFDGMIYHPERSAPEAWVKMFKIGE